jgi:hypothetical protein
MKDSVQDLVGVFEEETDKQSERNAKASLLFCQLIAIFII